MNNKLLNSFKQNNIIIGYLYFYIHFITEIICFYTLSKVIGNSIIVWIIPFIYDAFAFVPQSLIGYLNDLYPKINFGLIGFILLIIGFISFILLDYLFISIILICLGNSFIHVRGALLTLNNSNGKLSHSAIFVSGGSFGVITGKLLASYNISFILILAVGLTMLPFILLAEYYNNPNNNCDKFNYHNKNVNANLIIILTVFIVAIRGYIGYGIPTSWNKTVLQTILLYTMMGFGKALGGILSDAYGIKKIAISSMLLSIPFLIFGDNIMIISLIGVLLFSMTMSITLALLVSVLKRKSGLAFGLTTIGLFLGTVPIFFIKIINPIFNNVLIISVILICTFIAFKLIGDDNE